MRVAGPFGCRCQTIPPCSVSTSRSSNRVPRKPSNAGGGKGPDFGSGLEVGRIGRVTMLSITSNQRFGSAEGPSDGGEETVSCRFVGRLANPVGEPDAGNPPVRFDEREVETGLAKRHRKLVTKWAGNQCERFFPTTAPPLDSTAWAAASRACG